MHLVAPVALWQTARDFICVLFNLFGAPEALAAKHTLTAEAHKLILTWLRAGEALMRRLLLVEAAAHAKPNTRPLLKTRRRRVPRLMGFEAEHPEAWRVSFRCLIDAPSRAHSRVRAKRSPKRFYSAWPLAERMEALLRAFNDPAPYASRLARRLHATPHRARALCAHPANAPDLIGREGFAATDRPAGHARAYFESG